MTSALLAIATPATGATTSEGGFPGGDFGNAFNAATLIGNGYDTVAGTTDGGWSGNIDISAFTGLASGARTPTFTLSAPAGIGRSFASGGSVYYSTGPFRWNRDGSYGGTLYIGYYDQTSTASFALGSGFAGTLCVGIHGRGPAISHIVGVRGSAPAPVPLPGVGGAHAGGRFGPWRCAAAPQRGPLTQIWVDSRAPARHDPP